MRWSTSLFVFQNRSLYSKHLIHPINIFIKILRCRTQQGFHLIRFLWTKQGWKDAKARTPVRQRPLLLGLLGLFFHCFPSHSHLSILSAEWHGNLQCELCRMRIQYSKNGRWMIQWLTKENVCSMASVYSPTWLPLQIQKSWTYCRPGSISHSQQLLTTNQGCSNHPSKPLLWSCTSSKGQCDENGCRTGSCVIQQPLIFPPTDLKMNFVKVLLCVFPKKLTRFLFCHRWTAWPTGIRTSWGSWQPCKLSPAQHSNRPWRIWRIPTRNARCKSSIFGDWMGLVKVVSLSSTTEEYINWRGWRNKKGVGLVH